MDSLGYHFKDRELLAEALTHPSSNLKKANGTALSYQRLEFLGDSILGAVISDLLYHHFPDEAEGALARRKAVLVSKKSVAEVVYRLKLHEHIRFSATEKKAGSDANLSIQEDIGEALIGAIFVDGGFQAAHDFIEAQWVEKLKALEQTPIDPKTALQEWAQGHGLPLPLYEIIAQEGPDHAPIFTVEVSVKNHPPERSEATSKRIAEKAAAQKLLEKLEQG